MDLAENRFGKTWKHFLEVLKVGLSSSCLKIALRRTTGTLPE